MVRLKIGPLVAGAALVLTSVMAGAGPATADEPIVTTPDNVRADVGVSSVTIEWDPSVSREAEILYYTVKVGTRWFFPSEPIVTDLYLAKDTTYAVMVQATDAEYNRSEWSEPFRFTTPDEFPVTTPGNVRTSTSPGTLTVEWDPSSSDAGVRDYLVTVDGAPLFCSPSCGKLGGRTSETSRTFDIPPGADASVTVRAVDNAFRYSDTSEPIPVTVPPADDWQPPTAPENLELQFDARGRSFLATWDASQGTGPIFYHFQIDGQAVDKTQDLELEVFDFVRCGEFTSPPMDVTVIATAYGFESPESNPVEVCF